jgi:AmiR/NasT family two-component response regulator
MEQRSIDAQEAFNLLRQTSQRLNLKLRDVAAHLVERRQLPDS